MYALYRRGKLYYVGLTKGLLGRLKMHLHDNHGNTWDRFSVYITIGPAYMREIESVLIRIVSPSGNKQRGRFIRSENLLPKVKAEYRRRKKQEEEEIFGFRRKQEMKTKAPKKKTQKAKGQIPILAPYAGQVKRLRARFKGKMFYARVLKDGWISVGGQRYLSPSTAGAVLYSRSLQRLDVLDIRTCSRRLGTAQRTSQVEYTSSWLQGPGTGKGLSEYDHSREGRTERNAGDIGKGKSEGSFT